MSHAGESRLAGLTILRYAHASGSGGGVEQYLSNLNRALGERNRFATIQMEISEREEQLAETVETLGGCRLTRVPLFVNPASWAESVSGKPETFPDKVKSRFVRNVLCASPVYELFTKRCLLRRTVRRQPGEPDNAGQKTRELIKRFHVDLIVIHSPGGADASEIMAEAERANIPVALVHHFANERLASLAMCRQTAKAAGVAGVCGCDVPGYLLSNFSNLSDGVDTDFFRTEKAEPLPKNFPAPILFLPARITPSKGQADLLRVASLLKQRGIRVTVAQAGRVDSPAFENELRAMARREGLDGQVEFVGQLDARRLRDWYGAARVLVFPTRHHEGLPRILMECQAMGLPPVVYDIGGTPEGLLDGQTGFLIPSGDVRRMADAVETLLKDDAKRSAMSEAGRRFVEKKFSLRALAGRHEDFYLKILEGRRRGAKTDRQT